MDGFAPYGRARIGWLPGSAVRTVTSSGTYRVYQFDSQNTSRTCLLEVDRDAEFTYYLSIDGEARDGNSSYSNFVNGVAVRIMSSATPAYTWIIDLNNASASSNSSQDAAMVVGQTLNDTYANMTLSTVAVGGSHPNRWADVQVTFGSSGSDYVFLENIAHSKYLQCTNTADGTGSGSNVRGVNTNKTGTWTQWKLVDTGDGYYRVENNNFGLWLQGNNTTDVTDGLPNGAADSPTWVVRANATSNTGDFTKWKKVDAGSGYFRLECKANGKWLQCTDVDDVDTGTGDGGVQLR
ncbi:MAG: RICIN domain-containing protein, partial [Desulfobacterales bacterium]|nr:RICIN domain-containing protein [Desulfobacterales bacterium]